MQLPAVSYIARVKFSDWRGLAEPLEVSRIVDALSKSARSWLRQVEVFEEIDSTNLHLTRIAAHGSIDGRVALAEFQTHGRGRRGRSWSGTAGSNVALSIGHSVDVPVAKVGALSLVVGLAVADALDCAGIGGVGLKWPNDIMLGTGKLGGILIELIDAAPPAHVVIGVGINVQLDPATRAAIPNEVAAIADVRAGLDRSRLAGALISRIHEFTRAFAESGFARFRPLWESLNVHRGRVVEVIAGDMRTSGRVCGVTDAGELRLDTAAGEMTFNSGEVSLRVSND
ncbi:MAG: biotin--[acetyl-CoA-carboxylase] ligase [Gammaproteobacteria bacterium]|nr:biotin--[acetyl-CoA-carboxylase] ligase [Gammaproteobacteria bacterium]